MKKGAIFLFLIFSLLIFTCAKQTAEDHYKKGFRFQLKQNYEAIDAYKQAIRYFPLHTKAYYNLGWVYNLKGDKEKATQQYEQLKSLDPQLAQRLKEAIDKK